MKARMRRLSVSVDSAVIDHADDVRSTDGAEISFHERVRKLLSSPLSRRKSASNAAASSSREGGKLKVFGSPLFNLAHVDHPPSTQYLHSYRKEPGIPYVMTRLCDFIEKESGLNQEGLFRISANVRLVEKLRRSFDESGDAPLEDAGDVAAAAALLKQFLRDLPQPVIPTHLNQPFFAAVRDLAQGQTDGRERLKALVAVLPSENFHLLKYICTFLHRVSLKEDSNRMNSCSLGIVFGPNIFRVSSEDYKAYKDQAISGPNQIVSLLISECDYVFDEELRKKTGSLKYSDLESTSNPSQRKGKVKRRGASEGEKDSFCQRLNSHIIPILILNNETLSTSMQPQNRLVMSRKRRESRFLGADCLLYGRSASTEERPPSPDDQLTPLASDMRRCLSTDEMTSANSGEFSLLLNSSKISEEANENSALEGPDEAALLESLDESAEQDIVPPIDRDRVSAFCDKERTTRYNIPESIPMRQGHRNSWPRDYKDLQKISIKSSYVDLSCCPIAQSSVGRDVTSAEPPISPSAFRGYLSQRSQRLSDPNVAPSPPQEQEFQSPAHTSPVRTGFQVTVLKDTRIRIHDLKGKLKEFDKTFEEEQGRKARIEEKMESPVAGPLIKQLLQLRRSLRDFRQTSTAADSDDDFMEKSAPDSSCGQLSATMAAVQHELENKRSLAGRPADLTTMTREQMMQEKIELQKALLRFESVHGRPTCKEDRDIVRPLYDRYRAVKRSVGRLAAGESDHTGSDLPPIPEHVVMTFASQTTQSSRNVEPNSPNEEGSAVSGPADGDRCSQLPEQSLHELPLVELVRLLQQSRRDKRRFRRLIRTFEDGFIKTMGRKVEKSDRGDMANVYASYKHAKGRVRLLEALVTKTDKVQRLSPHSTNNPHAPEHGVSGMNVHRHGEEK